MTRRQLPNPLAVRAHQGYARRDGRTPRPGVTPRFGAWPGPGLNGARAGRGGLTIVEMLVAMSITLLIMAAVVTVFANISASVTRRRATVEMSSALRNVRETLARDLAGATCPAVPWQRPESNQGYLEIIEGPQNDYYPTPWLWDGDGDGLPDGIGGVPGIDLSLSSLPGSNLGGDPINDIEGKGLSIGSNAVLPDTVPTDGRGLGDADDTLMLTVRNEKKPFVGRIPSRTQLSNTTALGVAFGNWQDEEVESPLAEVVWFAVENPVDPNRTFAFGEPGYRTIYRRALLIVPDVEYGFQITGNGQTVVSAPGVVRVLNLNLRRDAVRQALAALIAFQERYDLSVRLEWDAQLPGASNTDPGRWVLKTNTLGDLTKRENRYEHHGYVASPVTIDLLQGAPTGVGDRFFPFAAVSAGRYANNATPAISLSVDPEISVGVFPAGYELRTDNADGRGIALKPTAPPSATTYAYRPYGFVGAGSDIPATVRAILDESGRLVHMTMGLAPLGNSRRGEDVMLTDALAFDLRAYDPGAPVYGYYGPTVTVSGGIPTASADQIVSPGDPAWAYAYYQDATGGTVGDGVPTLSTNNRFLIASQGAYVDLGYRASYINPASAAVGHAQALRTGLPYDANTSFSFNGVVAPRFFIDGLIYTGSDIGTERTTRFANYDTWSWHYENNGINEDGDRPDGAIRAATTDPMATDEGVNGLDDPTIYDGNLATRFGPDDYAERETRPPYDSALRGMQVTLRAYERDSRQVREVRVRESFVPE